MMRGWMIVSDALCGSIRVTLCLYLLALLLPVGRPGRGRLAVGGAGALAIMIATNVIGLPEYCRMAAEVILIAACAGIVPPEGTGAVFGKTQRRPNVRMCLYLAVFYEIAVDFWQFLLSACVGILLRLPEFPPAGSLAGQLGNWLTHLILTAAVLCVCRKAAEGDGPGYRPVMTVALAGFLAVITLTEQKLLLIPEDTLYMWTILAVVLMMAVLVFRISRQYEMERELAELKAGQAELLERDYTALRDTYAVSAKLFHDFHNHIGVLRQLLSHEKYAEAVQYLDELQAPVRGLAETVWTGDGAADYLINSRIASAPEAGIRFEVQVEFPRHADLKSADLCAILGNLLDNAMEAAGQVPEGSQRFVRLVIRRIHQMLVIKVENGYTTTVVENGGQLQTTKTAGGLHGWGLKSAQTAAEKYDGTVQTSREEGVFTAVATLSFTGMDAGGSDMGAVVRTADGKTRR